MKQLTDLKTEHTWLNDCPSQSLQHAISHLDNAFTNFFKGRAEFPVFKSKKKKQSFHCPSGIKVDWENQQVFIPKLKWVKFIVSRGFNGTIRNATVSKTPTGTHFISILVETGEKAPVKQSITKERSVGVDVGLKDFAVLSDGTKIDNPKYLFNNLSRLRIEKRKLQRRFKKGAKEQSKNWQKQRLVVAKLYEKVASQRKDFLHKTSTAIVKQYDTIVMEDLNVAGMVKNKNLSRSISDVGWAMFKDFIHYKCEWYGKNFHQIGRFEPSSRICSECGDYNHDLKLSHREWTCKNGHVLDRDLNAARNIKNFGLSKIFREGTFPLSVNVSH